MLITTLTAVDGEPASPGVVHLAAAGTSLVLDATGDRLPRVVYWGADLGRPTEAELGDLVRAARPPVVSNSIDDPLPVGVLAEAATGWPGTPGIAGSRAGRAFSPLFTTTAVDLTADGTLITAAQDTAAGLALELRVGLSPSGVVRLGATVTNTGGDDYALDALTLNLPVPVNALELLDFSGRHLRERAPQRHPFTVGSHVRSGRRGRTGLDATLLLLAGEPGFGFRRGEVWGVHTAWSGNHTTYAERDTAGVAILAGGELLLPGEIILSPGESYAGPTLMGSYGDGMDELSGRFHADLRSRPEHPASPRPIALNTWEAVYFDHDPAKLRELAGLAARVGAERFTLDDGWFRGRRSDHSGLGDWFVDEQVWPDGLHPIADHVRSLGMQFGLWVEPEMVNPDSDLARAHPEWILRPDARLPPEARHQQVLDISRPDAYAYVLERLDALVTEYGVGYLKWDHNRDLVDAGHTASGTAGVHDQTRALYRLLDELRAKHPALEIESCSSGGGRADLEILARSERIWASDCLDALERQHIQRWSGLLLPPEMLGSHVGAPTAHTTGRTHTLDFRAGTAFFGHFGMEWDLTSASETELAELTAWIALHKRFRPLLHSGTVVRGDHPDPAHWLHGVVAQDRAEALFAFVALQTGAWAPPGRIRLPGLASGTRYTVRFLSAVDRERRHGLPAFPDWADRPLTLSGAALATAGFQAPALQPEQLQLIHVLAEH
ncbi:alpha-galactosidase [Amycolatopsis sp. DG1A-15b]|uniref:alpha-galactosidase n=1 Tax=Amycolatopsis sp. DG1A-15b TaxID=3052846 RepID=UPI00255C07CC|nr:alpha-galactosidase [Amycolatopsis sp. DG1A-15b]WIX92088.1 alpha-galactosidase [Amycolatopsis sp. DG1A-15b]